MRSIPKSLLFISLALIAVAHEYPSQSLDSLRKVVSSTQNDTIKVQTLLLLAGKCSDQDILQYAEPALALSEKNLKTSGGSSLLKRFYLEAIGSSLTSISYYHLQYHRPAEALKSAERALSIHRQLNDAHCIANSLVGMGNIQINLKDGSKALQCYEEALSLCEKNKDSLVLAPLLNNIATVYSNAARLALALDYMHRSLSIYKNLKDTMGIARQLGAISLVYQKQGDAKKAQDYNFESLHLAEHLNPVDEFQVARILHNIGHVYVSSGEFEKAEPYFNRSMALSEKLHHDYGVAFCLIGLAKIYQNRGENDRALTFFKRGLKLNEDLNDRLGICVGLQNLCEYYKKTGQLSLALDYGKRSLTKAQELNYPGKISACAKLLYDIYKQQKQYQPALAMFELYSSTRDSVKSEENRKAALGKQLQYEFDKRKDSLRASQENALLKFESAKATMLAENEKKRLVYISSIAVAGLVLLLTLLILLRTRSRKKQKETEFEKELLMMEQQALRAQMNPHFIFNAINSIQNYILRRDKQEAYDYLGKFSKLIRMVLNNSQEKDLFLYQELEMIQLYVELEQLRFNNFSFTIQVSDDVRPYDTTIPSMLIQPYIENAISHGLINLEGGRRGNLQLDVSLQEGVLKIVVADNGIGRERSRQFKKADAHTSLGMTFTEKRLSLINKMKGYSGSRIVVEDLYHPDGSSAGTRVEIYIPADDK